VRLGEVLKNDAILSHPVKGTDQTQGQMLFALNPNDSRLADPNLDDYEQYIMFVFNQLDGDRSIGMNGILPFNLQSIQTYCNLFEDKLSIDEVMLLQRIDKIYLSQVYKLKRHD